MRLLNSPTNAVYAPDQGKATGHLFWVRDGALMAQSFDPEKEQLTGEAAIVAQQVAFGTTSRLAAVSVSNDGTLFYGGAGIRRYQLTWYDREGKSLGVLGQPEAYRSLRISPDGKRVALTRSADIWLMEFTRGIQTRVTFRIDKDPTRINFGGGNDPIWSPDSQRIAYWKGGPNNLFAQNANGTGSEERLIQSPDSLRTQDWSPDGKFLLYLVTSNDLSLKTRTDLWLLPMTADRKPVPFLTTPFREGQGQLSPDGKWVAYTSDESGGNEIYVRSFPAGGSKTQVSSNGGDWVRWRKDSKEIFYVAPDRKVMSVTVRAGSRSLEFGTPGALFAIPVTFDMVSSAPYAYDVMPDGQRFLALAPAADAEAPVTTIVLNWQAELSARQK